MKNEKVSEQTLDPSVVTFFMVGCPRCGTTWLHSALKEHPEVYLPAQKQTYFFDVNYDKGLPWYLSNYADIGPRHKAAGEIATGYAEPHALPRLARDFPHARILIAMRDPAERAYSFYQSRAVGEGWNNFREAVDAQPAILDQGKYIEHIERIFEHFPPERVQLLFYDDLKEDDRGYLRRVLEFLDVDADFDSRYFGSLVQVAAFPRLRRLLRRLRMGFLVDVISRSAIGDILRKRLKSSDMRRYPSMDADTRAFLRDYYRPYNDRLAALCGRDLASWKA